MAMWQDLWQHAIDWGNPNEAAAQSHEPEQGQVIVVRWRLIKIELRLLRKLGGYAVVKEEEHCDDQRWDQRSCYVGARHIPEVLQQCTPDYFVRRVL